MATSRHRGMSVQGDVGAIVAVGLLLLSFEPKRSATEAHTLPH